MENELTMNATEPKGNFAVKTLDKEGQHMSQSDILNRRLKNRERQRRYRARKRIEANTKKALNADPRTVENALVQQERNDNSCVTSVPSRRNWKQDARRAHSCNTVDGKLETARLAALSLKLTEYPSMALEMETVPFGGMKGDFENSLIAPSYEAHKIKIGGRNWKAEARNMKS